jgi:hypothetical protein
MLCVRREYLRRLPRHMSNGHDAGIIAPEARMDRTTRQTLLSAAAVLSFVAAVIHVWVMPEHFEEWWGYGLFFLVAAAAQALFAVAILRAPSPALLRVGIIGNLAIVALWVITRTIGIPVFGPHAGEIEEIGQIDLASKLVEILLVVLLGVLLRKMPSPQVTTGAAAAFNSGRDATDGPREPTAAASLPTAHVGLQLRPRPR